MARGWKFVVARGAHGRPTLMHRTNTNTAATLCGLQMTGWSRAYLDTIILQIMCKRCEKEANHG